jgi:hypothetical protein
MISVTFTKSPLFVGLLVLGGVVAGFHLARGGTTPKESRAAESATVPAAATRGEVQRLIEKEVHALNTEAEVENYLATLEQRARTRGDVGALEVETGFAALRTIRASAAHTRGTTSSISITKCSTRSHSTRINCTVS